MAKNKPKIIIWDLETMPDLEAAMEEFTGLSDFPGRTMRASINSIICFGYKELGAKRAKCVSAWDYPKRWKKDINDDYEVVKAAHDVLSEADGIITHNGIKFDLKVLNTRLLYHGLDPLPKIPHIDTCAVARKRLSMFSNRLGTIAKYYGLEDKMDTGGWSLWVDTMKRIKRAQTTMTKYCKQDVDTLEQVYYKLRPLIDHIPNYNIFHNNFGRRDEGEVCPSCGSDKLRSHGWRHTNTRSYRRYKCGDCGSYSRADTKDQNLRKF